MKKGIMSLLLALVMLMGGALVPQVQDTAVAQVEQADGALAFIYMDDGLRAGEFETFLESNNYSIALVPLGAVAKTDFSSFDGIIIGDDTGAGRDWGDAAAVAAVYQSGKPVVGLGEGGYAFFGKLQLDLGYGNGWHGTDSEVYVMDPGHAVFNTPNPIAVPPSGVISLYAQTAHVGIKLDPVPADVEVLGREVGDQTHYPLALEEGRYLLWGFSASPVSMTETGMALFLNILDYLIVRSCYEAIDQAQEGTDYGYWFERTVNRWQEFKPSLDRLTQVDLYIRKVGWPGDMRVSLTDQKDNTLWNIVVPQTQIGTLGWVEIPVSPMLSLTPNESYYINVSSTADSPDENQRYFWRGQPDSGYSRGMSSVEDTRPGYDFAFRTWGCLGVQPLHLSLNIEDALEGVPVNKVVGDSDGPAKYTYVDVVTKLKSNSSSAKDNIPVVLTVPGDVFGAPVNTWVRNGDGGALTPITPQNLGSGQYKVTADLFPVMLSLFQKKALYRKQIVWRFRIPNDLLPQDVAVSAQIQMPAEDPSGNGIVRVLAPESVRNLMVANRSLLYENYTDSEVSALLQRMYTEAQGYPASHTPKAVIYYADRHSELASDWDNTTVNLTSEANANVVANAIDDLIEDWHDDATKYVTLPFLENLQLPISSPSFLLIAGDDDTIPFYRYDDPYNDEITWSVTSSANPAIEATDHDFILTDNPYADLAGGTDWQTGDVELYTGRILGETAADMLSLLEEGVSWANGNNGGVVMASVDGWELGLEPDDGRAGEIADIYDATALLRGKGFAVRNDDIPGSEVRTIDVMSPFEDGSNSWNTNFKNAANNTAGMDIFFIGGHDGYDHAVIPGDDYSPDDTCAAGTCEYNRFDDDHPIVMIVGCHGGLPVPDVGVPGGADDDMVYDAVREGASAYIGATGFSYGSPNNLHKATWGERLMQEFFHQLTLPSGGNSMALGAALAKAKDVYVFGFGSNDALDRKTVTEFNLYGVPWTFVYYPGAAKTVAAPALESIEKAFTTQPQEIQGLGDDLYLQTFGVTVEGYKVQEEGEYQILSIPKGDLAVADGLPILPYLEGYSMVLPYGASVISVELVDAGSRSIGTFNVPNAAVEPFSEGGLTYTTKTDIDVLYPAKDNLVQYQQTGDELVFTLFPIQHTPTTDETVFYETLKVEVTYEAPLSVVVTDFAADKESYATGETINAEATVANVGDTPISLLAYLQVLDSYGHASQDEPLPVEDFEVKAGSSHTFSLEWSGKLPDGDYTLELILESAAEKAASNALGIEPSKGTPMGGASDDILVSSGAITQLVVPEGLHVGEEGFFDVIFANQSSSGMEGTATLSILDGEGGLVQTLPAQPISPAAGTDETVTFSWTPADAGDYSAITTVEVGEQVYGPVSQAFSVALVDVDIAVVLQGTSRPPEGWEIPLTIKLFAPGADVLSDPALHEFPPLITSKSESMATCTVGMNSGEYDITVSSDHTLINVRRSVEITGPTDSVLYMGILLEGDADENGTIDGADLRILMGAFMGYIASADFDRNGIVNISDFGLLAANFMKDSPQVVLVR